jgi:hypothetical protein
LEYSQQSTYYSAVDEGDTSQNGKRWDIHNVDIGEESLVLSRAIVEYHPTIAHPQTLSLD